MFCPFGQGEGLILIPEGINDDLLLAFVASNGCCGESLLHLQSPAPPRDQKPKTPLSSNFLISHLTTHQLPILTSQCQPWTSTSPSTRSVIVSTQSLETDHCFKIIASKPRVRRGGRGGARPPVNATRARYAPSVPKAAAPAGATRSMGSEAAKIIISNLPADVTEAAVRVSRHLRFCIYR